MEIVCVRGGGVTSILGGVNNKKDWCSGQDPPTPKLHFRSSFAAHQEVISVFWSETTANTLYRYRFQVKGKT